jgi:hypothetical protein
MNFFEEMSFGVFQDYLLTRIMPQLNDSGQKSVEKLRNVDQNSIIFYEQYGCAVLFSNASYGVSRVPQIAIVLIGLDPWKFSCSERKDLDYVMTSLCGEYSYLSLGTIDKDRLGEYLSTFHSLFKEASNKPGHQKTPGFILSILQQSFPSSDSKKLRSCPGFTDVGQHSGQVPSRDTRWSLVRMVTKHILATNVKVSRVESFFVILFDYLLVRLRSPWDFVRRMSFPFFLGESIRYPRGHETNSKLLHITNRRPLRTAPRKYRHLHSTS